MKTTMTVITKRVTLYLQIFIFALLGGGCSPDSGRAIEKVLNRCANINTSNMSAAQAAQFFASKMQNIDTRDCPPEFRAAFQQHINAWREASGAFSENTELNAFIEGFAAGYFQDSSLLGISQQNAAIAANNINVTYNQLVTIAAAYGARVPESVLNLE